MVSDAADRARASRLRRRLRRGTRPLSDAELAWLREYEAARGVRADVADVAVGGEAEEPSSEVGGEAAGDEGEEEGEVGEEEGEVGEEEKPQLELAPAARVARAAADRVDHGTALLINAVELHERVSARALAMMERMGELAAQQSEQLVDALEALALARAELVEQRTQGELEEQGGGSLDEATNAIMGMLQKAQQSGGKRLPQRRQNGAPKRVTLPHKQGG